MKQVRQIIEELRYRRGVIWCGKVAFEQAWKLVIRPVQLRVARSIGTLFADDDDRADWLGVEDE